MNVDSGEERLRALGYKQELKRGNEILVHQRPKRPKSSG